jgi:hypothetical protein
VPTLWHRARHSGVDANQIEVEKISSFESPEKWAIRNKQVAQFAESTVLFEAIKHNFSLLALRVLLDAFLYMLGYHGIECHEWTQKEKAPWERKKQASGLTRDQKYKGHLMEYGFADSELLALFNAATRLALVRLMLTRERR